MEEALHVMRLLWGEGPVHFQGAHYTLAGLEGLPKPVQKPHPPLFIGGSGQRMLRLAGREADIVGILPPPLPRGGHDWLASTSEAQAEQIGWVRAGAGDRFDSIELSAVAFRAVISERPADVAATFAPGYGITPEQLLASPDFLIGNVNEIVERLLERRERLGVSYIEIDDRDSVAFAPVVARLAEQ
jgi:alkanesulfonate monooxygenase SsuD/methylene tetrahydromethanopterin reductase-like flavin-dependent oxidoreductase (luciferase family)